MTFLANQRMAVKLPALMIGVTLICVLIGTGLTLGITLKQRLQEISDRMTVVADGRAYEIEEGGRQGASDVQTYASSVAVQDGLLTLTQMFDKVPGDRTAALQKLYIDDNPNPSGKKQDLDDANDGSAYSVTHRHYHPFMRTLQQTRNYYDVFLISPAGDVIYTVFKERDFAANVATGPLAESGLGSVWKQAMDPAMRGKVVFADFEPYGPSNDVPAGFVAEGVYQGERLIGVLAFQLPVERLEALIASHRGMTDTTRVIVVGPNLLTRSPNGLSGAVPLLTPVPANPGLSAALAGTTGAETLTLEDGAAYLTAFQPVNFLGTRWALMAVEPRSLAVASTVELGATVSGVIAVVMVLAAGLCLLVARSMSRPLTRMGRVIEAIGRRDFSVEVPDTGRGDEIGMLARGVAHFKAELGEFYAAAVENRYKSTTFSETSAALMITDADFNIKYVNRAVMEILRKYVDEIRKFAPHFDPDDVIGRNMDFFHADPSVARRIVNDPARLPYLADISLGEFRVTLLVSPVNDGTGERIGAVVEWNDVTIDHRNKTVIDAIEAYQCMGHFDGEGRLIEANARLAEAFGTGAAELRGRECTALFDLAPAAGEDPVWERLGRGLSVYGRFPVRLGSGEAGLVEGGFAPVRDRRGKLVRVIFMGNDRSAAERALQAAEATRQQMEAAQALVVDQLRIALGRLAAGDLTATIETAFGAEYESLRADFNAAITQLMRAMQAIVDSATAITSESGSISEAAVDLAKRTERQAATLEETAAALDQLTASVRQAASGAQKANELVVEARRNAEASGTIVGQTVDAMGEIAKSSEQISKIISVIDDIAFQTNLLALNAGVEAARAGEAGRGFAVVASEVRALAQRSSDAAREINGLISESGQHVQLGVQLVDKTGSALRDIVASVGDISGQVRQIAESAQEQSTGLAEINTAVNQLDQTTQQNAAMFEETTAASQSLQKEAQALSGTVDHFELGQGRRGGAAVPDRPASSDKPVKSAGPAAPVKAAAGVAAGRRPKPATAASASAPASTAAAQKDLDWEDF